MSSLYHQLRRDLLDPIAWQLSKHELHRLMQRTDIPSIIDAVDTYRGRGHYACIHAYQKREEISALAELVRARQPKTVLEIGTHRGGTLFIWARLADPAATIVSVDLEGGIHGGGYNPRRQRLHRQFIADRPAARMVLFQRDSQSAATRDAVAKVFAGRPVDFLFIDADHRYEGVRRDFELYEPLVAPGGMIAFHDIVPQREHKEYGVDRFWREVAAKHEHRELIRDPNQGSMGIGVLFKKRT